MPRAGTVEPFTLVSAGFVDARLDPDSVTWTADQLRTFLEGTRDSRHWTAYLVLATTGARRGEVLGLRWSDLDLDTGRASIRQTVIAVRHTPMFGTPKTAKGRRTVKLDAGTVAALLEHRKQQLAERLMMGAGWTDLDLVFCRVDGTMLHPERFTPSFSDAARRLGLPRLGPHVAMRHGWATLALENGIHPKGGGATRPRQHWHHARHLQPRRCRIA
jgi:integrase